MAHLCKFHQQKLRNASTDQLKTAWQELIDHGQNALDKEDRVLARKLFESALVVAQYSHDLPQAQAYADDFLQMEYLACQHLATTLTQQGYQGKAVGLMSQMHHKLLSICTSAQSSRLYIMGALGVLDSSLLSLTSNLGSLSQVDEIYDLIELTETVAAQTARQLWH